ncbi:MAG: hypothetical protein WCJ09_02300 [Planctomycetota bacterium]
MDSPAHSRPWAHPLLLICGCALLVGVLLFDNPAARIPPAKKRPTRFASSIRTVPVESPQSAVAIPLADSSTENDVRDHQKELDSTKHELSRISTELAAAQRAAELAEAQIECLESELSRFDVDLSVVEKWHASVVQEQADLASHTQARLARSADIVKNFEALQKQNLSQQFRQIESDRKAREQMRARLNQPSEDQNESIRERQRKRAASRQADAELAAFREQESARLHAEELAIQTRIRGGDRLQRKIAKQRQETLAKLDGVRQTLVASQSTIDLSKPQLNRLEAQRASLVASTRAVKHH